MRVYDIRSSVAQSDSSASSVARSSSAGGGGGDSSRGSGRRNHTISTTDFDDMPTFDDQSVSVSSSQDDAAMEMGSSKFLRTQLSETNMDDILASHSARLGGKANGTGAPASAPRRTSADLLDAPDMGGDGASYDEERGRVAGVVGGGRGGRRPAGSGGDDATLTSTRAEASDAGSVAPSEADLSMACPRASAAIVIEDILDGSDRCAPDGFMGWGPAEDELPGVPGDGGSPPSSPGGELRNRLDGSSGSRLGSLGSMRFDRLWDDANARSDDGGSSGAGSSETKSSVFFGKSRHGNGVDLARGAGGGGGGHCGGCRSVVRANMRRVGICLVLLVGAAVTVGTLATMVPIWMARGEAAIEGEVGSSSGGRNNDVMLDTSGRGGTTAVDTTFVSGGGGNFGLDPSYESAGDGPPPSSRGGPPPGPAVIAVPTPPTPDLGGFLPPPPDLKSVCGRRAISTPAGRDRCLSACLPSRCCLVPQGSPYVIWSRATLDPYEPDLSSLGTAVPSCFRRHTRHCVQYYDQCAVLGHDALIPEKVPTSDEMRDMTDAGLLGVAERVNRACGGRDQDARRCAALCEDRRCCFAGLDGYDVQSQSGGGTGSDGRPTGGGGGGHGSDPAGGGVGGSAPYQTDTYYDDFYPTESPTVRRTPYPTPTFLTWSVNELESYVPTGSEPPTPSVYLSRRRTEEAEAGGRDLRDGDVGHMGIPGDEDFQFQTNDPFAIAQSPGGGGSAPEKEAPAGDGTVESCAGDPMGFCTVFAGCARYFGR